MQHGGIGDLLIAMPWLNHFKSAPIPTRIYSRWPELTQAMLPWADSHMRDQLHRDKPPYYIDSIDLINFKFPRVKPGQVHDFVKPMYEHWLSLQDEWGDLIQSHPFKANEMGKKANEMGLTRNMMAFHLTGVPYQELNFDVSEVKVAKPIITFHDDFDTSRSYKFPSSMKNWPLSHWEALFDLIHNRYGTRFPIVRLGSEPRRAIRGIDENLCGKIPFLKSMEYLKTAVIHIDGDSGLVHARAILKKPSIVLFGPTNVKYFGYSQNINMAPRFCGDCWWQKSTWMEKCVKEYSSARCMESITAEMVFQEVAKILGE